MSLKLNSSLYIRRCPSATAPNQFFYKRNIHLQIMREFLYHEFAELMIRLYAKDRNIDIPSQFYSSTCKYTKRFHIWFSLMLPAFLFPKKLIKK